MISIFHVTGLFFFIVVPEFVEKPSNVTALTGSNATFLCVVTGIPKPAITWNFSGGVLAEHVLNDDGSLSVLFINNSATYEGAYTCKAYSTAGERSATAWLSVDGKGKPVILLLRTTRMIFVFINTIS